MTIQALTLQRQGLTLHASLHGNPAHPLVVLLHGFPDTPHCWDKVYPVLVKAGYQVLIPWLRGYTIDSVNRKAHYGLASATTDLTAWLEKLQLEKLEAGKFHLVGHDWGAAIALTFASQYAHLLHSVSLLAVPPVPGLRHLTAALRELPEQLIMSSYMLLMQTRLAERILSRNHARFVEAIWKKWSPTWPLNETDFAPTRQAFSQPDIAWAASRYYHNLFAIHHAINRQANRQLLTPITVPTLALAGLNDGCMSIRLHQKLASPKAFPAAINPVYLPDCGHFLQAEQPLVVAGILLKHFSAH